MPGVTRVAGLGVLLALILLPAPWAGASGSWSKLRRQLHIPRIAPGSPCPVTPARRVNNNFGSGNFSLAQGSGPVYPLGGFPALRFVYPPPPQSGWYGSEWGGEKVLWIARPSYRGPVLIRGRQLDGIHGVRFGRELDPSREMRLRSVGGSSPGGWQNRPSFTRLRAPGCYAWQVDGTTFSRVIVFQAVLAS
jgi:hypothetical protein